MLVADKNGKPLTRAEKLQSQKNRPPRTPRFAQEEELTTNQSKGTKGRRILHR
jgi:hypothetical protein